MHDVIGMKRGNRRLRVATITGHSLRDIGTILESYTARTDKIAIAAITKLERERS